MHISSGTHGVNCLNGSRRIGTVAYCVVLLKFHWLLPNLFSVQGILCLTREFSFVEGGASGQVECYVLK